MGSVELWQLIVGALVSNLVGGLIVSLSTVSRMKTLLEWHRRDIDRNAKDIESLAKTCIARNTTQRTERIRS